MEQDIVMELVESIIQAQAPKKKRKNKVLLLGSVNRENESESKMLPSENDDLNLHVSLCEERYKALEKRLDGLETRLTKVEDQITGLKKEVASGFGDLKLLIEKQNNARTIQLIATFGTIAVAVIGLLGYIITH